MTRQCAPVPRLCCSAPRRGQLGGSAVFGAGVTSELSARIVSRPERRATAARVSRRELLLVCGLAFALAILVTAIKVVQLDVSHGDDAMFMQLTHNAGSRGVGRSQIAGTDLDFVGRGMVHLTAEQVAADPLTPTADPERDEFRIHSYFILSPVGVLTRIIPVAVVLQALFVASFVGMVLLVYIAGRRAGLSPLVTAALCALVVWHPAWTQAFQWEFYPDRLFVLLGFALMLAASSERTAPFVVLLLAVLCAAINERTAAIGGLFLMTRALFFWRAGGSRRVFDVATGAAMIVYALAIMHWYLDKTSIISQSYDAFFPSTSAKLVAFLSDPAVQGGIALFLLASAALLFPALVEWRGAAIALLIMLPNIFGSYGGVEKTGWYSHYHDLYLPALVWAALTGLVAADHRLRGSPAARAIPLLLTVLVLAVAFYRPATGTFAVDASADAFLHWVSTQARLDFGPSGAELRADADAVRRAIPAGALVSSVESGMPLVYDGRTVDLYPLGIDRARYAIVAQSLVAGRLVISGFPSVLGPAETAKIDAVLERRMRRAGFDLDHPLVRTHTGLAVFKRRSP
jgi:hypothetical protein